jgi:hypothetical protein
MRIVGSGSWQLICILLRSVVIDVLLSLILTPSWAKPIAVSTYSCQLFRLWLPIMQCAANSSPHFAF